MIKPGISVIPLTLMAFSAVDNIRNLPSNATFGQEIIFFYLFACLFFFLPSTLVSAQLSSTRTPTNGIYDWVKMAWGPRLALTAVWLQWIVNLVWYPALLSFVVSKLGHFLLPEGYQRTEYLIVAATFCFYFVSILSLYGHKPSLIFERLCLILGIALPLLFIGMGISGYIAGTPLSNKSILSSPILNPYHLDTGLVLICVVFSLCGVEMSRFQTRKSEPQKRSLKALLLAILILLSAPILGSCSMISMGENPQFGFIASTLNSLKNLLYQNGLFTLLKCYIFISVLAGLGTLNNWLTIPIKGLQQAARDNLLPKAFKISNQHGVPVILLLVQTAVVTLFIALFSCEIMTDLYWVMTSLVSQLYMIMYLLMFISFIKLRNNPGYFKIPGGNRTRILVGLFGLLGCSVTLMAGFTPIKANCDPVFYCLSIFFILTILVLFPHLFSLIQKRITWIKARFALLKGLKI